MNEPRLTERDIAIIKDLQKSGILTMSQIANEHFEGMKKYQYKRMEVLMKRGYVKRSGRYYMASQKGLNIISSDVVNYKVRVPSYHMKRKSKVAQIYLTLCEKGWDWFNSIETKRMYHLNRGSKIDGMLRNTETGIDYALYMLTENPRQETIKKINTSIKNHQARGLNDVIIFSTTEKAGKTFVHDPKELVKLGTSSLKLFPYREESFAVLIKTASSTWFLNAPDFPTVDKIIPVDNDYHLFTDTILKIGAEEYYYADLCGNDLIKRYFLMQYTLDQAELEGKKVLITIMDPQAHKLRNVLGNAYPHFEIIPIPVTWLYDNTEHNTLCKLV